MPEQNKTGLEELTKKFTIAGSSQEEATKMAQSNIDQFGVFNPEQDTFGVAAVKEPELKKDAAIIDTTGAESTLNGLKKDLDIISPEPFTSPITGQKGIINEQGQFVPEAPAPSVDVRPKGQRTVIKEKVKVDEGEISDLDNQIVGLVNEFNSFNIDEDPDFQAEAQDIRNTFQALREDMQIINRSRQRALETLGYRTGSAQFAGAVISGIVGEEIRQGSRRITDITRQESSAISAARKAFREGEFIEFAQKMQSLDIIRDNKADALTAYNKSLTDAADQLRKDNQFNLDVLKFQLDLQESGQTTFTKEFNFAQEQGFEGTELDYRLVLQEIDDINKAPEKPTTIGSVEGGYYQYDTSTGNWIKVIEGVSPDVGSAIDWATAIANGTAKITEVPSDIRSQVITELNKMPPDSNKIAMIQDKIDMIEGLIIHPGMGESVGATKITRWDWWKFDSQKQDFIGTIQQLISKETIDTLISLKARGGTLGALSDQERIMLQSAATKIGTWAKTNSRDKVVGYVIGEKLFKKELETIKRITERALKSAGGGDIDSFEGYTTITQLLADKPDLITEVGNITNELTEKGYEATDENVLQTLQSRGLISLNQVGGNMRIAGMRTDRHNNPTAFTTRIAAQADLIEGIDYVEGDPFPDNPNLKTALLLEDPIETTIKVIDKIGFFTEGGKQRWNHTAMSKAKWDNLSDEGKRNVIKDMYQKEGNKGLLNRFFV